MVHEAIRSLIALFKVRKNQFELTLRPKALGFENQPCWTWNIPLPVRKPFRETKLRIGHAPKPAELRHCAGAGRPRAKFGYLV